MVGTSHRGYRDWLVQRLTAIIIGAYTIFLFAYLFMNRPLYFAQWHNLFQNPFMKAATFLVVISVLWHAWIGLWTVFTDYVKPKAIRLVLEAIVLILLAAYLFWLVEILLT